METNTEIPKIIHFCWFGGNPLPESARRCIDSWKKHLPDYEIKEWNESNFDINSIPYTAEAYKARKYAFVSDYARFWILYNYGGVYFDTDVEVLKDMSPIIQSGPYMGCETNCGRKGYADVNPGLGIAATPGLDFYREMIASYKSRHFCNSDGTHNLSTVVDYTSELLTKYGLSGISETERIAGINIYPKEYFCPKDYITNRLHITANTYTIHHYSATWKSSSQKMFTLVEHLFGYSVAHFIGKNLSNLHLIKK